MPLIHAYLLTHTHAHTLRHHTTRGIQGATAFPGFQRSSRESKERLDYPKRKSTNSSPHPVVGRSLKIVKENIVV